MEVVSALTMKLKHLCVYVDTRKNSFNIYMYTVQVIYIYTVCNPSKTEDTVYIPDNINVHCM